MAAGSRGTFRYPATLQAPLEPFVTIVEPSEDAITIYTTSQMPSFVRLEIARLLGWPENKVRVKVPLLGGGFGAKAYIKLEALVTALALISHRPVKIAATIEEQFAIITNHPATFRIKSGVSKEGRITARECEVLWNGGAYADIGPRISQKSGFTAPGPYEIENVKIDNGAEIEVDTETGHMRILRLINVADCGTPINPKIAHTQLSGAAIMALGATLFEKIEVDNGQVTNASLADYKIPSMHDILPMHNELVTGKQENGPLGAKGLGESGSFCVAPAVANALDDAVGVRLTALPLTPETILRAIRARAGAPIEQ